MFIFLKRCFWKSHFKIRMTDWRRELCRICNFFSFFFSFPRSRNVNPSWTVYSLSVISLRTVKLLLNVIFHGLTYTHFLLLFAFSYLFKVSFYLPTSPVPLAICIRWFFFLWRPWVAYETFSRSITFKRLLLKFKYFFSLIFAFTIVMLWEKLNRSS